MARFVSDEGVWSPSKEKVGLQNNSGKTITVNGKQILHGEPFIYEGPDRGALIELEDQGVTSFGESFRKHPEFLQAVRNQGFNNTDEYLKHLGYDEAKAKKEIEKTSTKITSQDELTKRTKMVETMGGGGKDYPGGFGEIPKI